MIEEMQCDSKAKEHLRGILRAIEPLGEDLKIDVAGEARLVPRRLEPKLRPLVGQFVHILRLEPDEFVIHAGRIRGDEEVAQIKSVKVTEMVLQQRQRS